MESLINPPKHREVTVMCQPVLVEIVYKGTVIGCIVDTEQQK